MEKGSGKKKVMVAIDESECSHYALEWTLTNLRETIQDSKLFIFNAQPFADLGYLYASTLGTAPVEFIASVQETHKRVAEALLEKAKNICTQFGVVAETLTEVGDVKMLICEAVDNLNIELLVVGSHGRGPIKRAFLGSVSNYCVQSAKCPVLVVKKNE